MTQIKIQVTRDDIENGKPYDAMRCPVARATNRTIPGADSIWSNSEFILIPNTGTLNTPGIVEDFIMKFDTLDAEGNKAGNRNLEPFEFTIEVPDSIFENLGKEGGPL